MKDQDMDEAHGKSEGVFPKMGCCMLKRTVFNFER